MTPPKNSSNQKTEISSETKQLPNEPAFSEVQNENEETSILKKKIESTPTISREGEENLNTDVDLGSEANKSNLQLPNETREKAGIKPDLATYERRRPVSLTSPKYLKAQKKFFKQVQWNKYIPMDDKTREYDAFRYGSTNLTENRQAFENDEKIIKNELDQSARLQTSLDLFHKSISVPAYPNKRPLSTVPLSQEEKGPFLLKYYNNQLTPEESQLFEETVLSDLAYSERTYLKRRIPNESTLLENKKHLSLSPAFDYKYFYYNVTSHYEGIAWLAVMVTWVFVLISILQRKEK